MSDSEDPKQVSNDLRNSQFGGGFINAGTVNAGQIGGDIYNIHLGQQTVASGNSVQSQSQRQRSHEEPRSVFHIEQFSFFFYLGVKFPLQKVIALEDV
ncbi:MULTISPECIES: hypothetical protein [unclassified Nostoc]|uniref:hypothetical protein n=1 Tax=unclassified Nostoc TaxID=2593658 RepID=UPI002AD56CD9|nr:hypothetical protein [Nostoc sp. DedQUE03]MDZ7976466.1 hypothetical protein [Nostoc sp. DedQUE03]MDZ8042789.1 hypothetical protein [Nostoc sp. DedQUE02]